MRKYFIALILVLSLSAVGFAQVRPYNVLLKGGESINYTEGGVKNNVMFVGASNATTAIVKVNAEAKSIQKGKGATIGGLYVYLNDIRFVSATNQVLNAANLSLGVRAEEKLYLGSGWNHVSGAVFKNMETDCDFKHYASRIWAHNGMDGWLDYTNANMNLKSPLEGFFVTVPQACTIRYSSVGMYEVIVFWKGWNIISGYPNANLSYKRFDNDRSCNYYPMLWSWNGNSYDKVNSISQMQPGRGYWVYIYDEVCEFSGWV